jgi:hypothetical protein
VGNTQLQQIRSLPTMNDSLLRQGYSLEPGILPASATETLRGLTATGTNRGFGDRFYLDRQPNVWSYLRSLRSFTDLIHRRFRHPTIVKSIYFDKPPRANWVVPWHQDLTINLSRPTDRPGFVNQRTLADRVTVQPPIELLGRITTFRIHLDDTDEGNGALRVVEGSHLAGIQRMDDTYIPRPERIRTLRLSAGGVQLMKPLLLHSSLRSTDNHCTLRPRRILHLEVIEEEHLDGLPWRECYRLRS